jgi:tetratricopeptide (TPR) repeat protein
VIALLLVLAAAQAAPVSDEAAYASCAAKAKADPQAAVAIANEWVVRGGGIFARQCLGLAYTGLERWSAAATAFEQAAQAAESAQDPRRGDFWVQAGNGWLAAGDAGKARKAFDAALATPAMAAELRGEVHLDRARALVLAADLPGARADIDQGLKLVPADPFGWYLSSALALKEGRLARAQDDIAQALRLAPDDANLLVHAGNVAGISGEHDAARGLYAKAISAAPQSEAARAARAALSANAAAPQSR